MQPIHYALQREYAECAKLLQVGYIHMYNVMHVYLPILSIRIPSQHAKDLIKSNSSSLYEIAIRNIIYCICNLRNNVCYIRICIIAYPFTNRNIINIRIP